MSELTSHTGLYLSFLHKARSDSPFRADEVRDLPPPTSESASSASRGTRKAGNFSAERQAKLNVDIKNGKVIFRQKPMSFEKMTETMQGA